MRLFPLPLSRTISGQSGTPALLVQVAWFNKLRLGAAAGVIWMTALATHALEIVDDPVPLYTLGGLILVMDGFYLLRFRKLAQFSKKRVRRHVDLQIGIDLLILTALLHFSGGITNPLVMFYMFHAFIAALLLSVTAAAVVACISFGLVAILGLMERWSLLQYHSLDIGLMDLEHESPLGLTLFLFAFASTLGTSIYFIATVLNRLRVREDELIRLSGQLAHSEKLASVGTLAAGVSHEINNPIGVIRNKVQILRYRMADGDPLEELEQELDTIEKHSLRIGAITEGLLTFSKETPFELRAIDLNAVCGGGN